MILLIATLELSSQNKYLGATAPPAFAVWVRVVRADEMMGYELSAYLDKPNTRVQLIIAALAKADTWKLCADGMLLSKHKVTVSNIYFISL